MRARMQPHCISPPAWVDLKLWVLCERDADGVTQPIKQQGANPDRALHAPILALACSKGGASGAGGWGGWVGGRMGAGGDWSMRARRLLTITSVAPGTHPPPPLVPLPPRLTRLCHTQVEGVVPPPRVLLLSKQAVGLHHHQGVGGLHSSRGRGGRLAVGGGGGRHAGSLGSHPPTRHPHHMHTTRPTT